MATNNGKPLGVIELEDGEMEIFPMRRRRTNFHFLWRWGAMIVQRNDCNDHWCENHGKGGGECDRCEKQTRSRNASDLQAVPRRRMEELFGSGQGDGKASGELCGQER